MVRTVVVSVVKSYQKVMMLKGTKVEGKIAAEVEKIG